MWFFFNNLTPASTRTHARTPGPEQRVGCRITEADCRQISGKYRATPSAKGIWKENKAVFTIAKVGTPHTPFRLRRALFACGGPFSPAAGPANLGRISPSNIGSAKRCKRAKGIWKGNKAVSFSSADCAYRLHYSEGGDTPHPVSPAACPFCLRRALQISGGSRADLGQTSGGPECCHPADRCMRRLFSSRRL